MPEIPAPPYQRLYTGYRYAGDVAPKTASMDLHGRPLEPVITSSLHDGEMKMPMCNTGLRVSQIAPKVPEQAPFTSYKRRRRLIDELKSQKPLLKKEDGVSSGDERFAWSLLVNCVYLTVTENRFFTLS